MADQREAIAAAEREATHGNVVEAFRMALDIVTALLVRVEYLERQMEHKEVNPW